MATQNVRERYNPMPLGVDATAPVYSQAIGGFLCITSGTLTITDSTGNDVVDALPVTAGVYVPLPFLIDQNTWTITLDDGASGVLAV